MSNIAPDTGIRNTQIPIQHSDYNRSKREVPSEIEPQLSNRVSAKTSQLTRLYAVKSRLWDSLLKTRIISDSYTGMSQHIKEGNRKEFGRLLKDSLRNNTPIAEIKNKNENTLLSQAFDQLIQKPNDRNAKIMVGLLLKYESDINAKDQDGNPLLFKFTNHPELLQSILESQYVSVAKIDFTAKNSDGNTLLHVATQNYMRSFDRLGKAKGDYDAAKAAITPAYHKAKSERDHADETYLATKQSQGFDGALYFDDVDSDDTTDAAETALSAAYDRADAIEEAADNQYAQAELAYSQAGEEFVLQWNIFSKLFSRIMYSYGTQAVFSMKGKDGKTPYGLTLKYGNIPVDMQQPNAKMLFEQYATWNNWQLSLEHKALFALRDPKELQNAYKVWLNKLRQDAFANKVLISPTEIQAPEITALDMLGWGLMAEFEATAAEVGEGSPEDAAGPEDAEVPETSGLEGILG